MDSVSAELRSINMRKIRSRDTLPERVVRSAAHSLGFRFRLHRKDLPGKPDLTFPRHHKVIFVHGCFWHQHAGCREGRAPSTNSSYWTPKLARTVERDTLSRAELERLGWSVLVVWECETEVADALRRALSAFLRP